MGSLAERATQVGTVSKTAMLQAPRVFRCKTIWTSPLLRCFQSRVWSSFVPASNQCSWQGSLLPYRGKRLAPLKAMTILRMELSAAVLATRLHCMIKQEVTLPSDQSTFWTDSTCVLCYIENKDKRFQTFVASRISAILEQSTTTQWRNVDTIQNPADEASRGMTVKALLRATPCKYRPKCGKAQKIKIALLLHTDRL